jgi:hypothetical protein
MTNGTPQVVITLRYRGASHTDSFALLRSLPVAQILYNEAEPPVRMEVLQAVLDGLRPPPPLNRRLGPVRGGTAGPDMLSWITMALLDKAAPALNSRAVAWCWVI